MKKVVSVVIAIAMTIGAGVWADTTKDAVKNAKQQTELTRKLLNEKPGKEAKKQAKKLRKQGWTESAGALAMEKQIDRAQLMNVAIDDLGNKVYIQGEAQSVGETIDGARVQAMELARLGIVQTMEQEIVAGIENALGNQQLGADEATTAMKTVINSRSVIKQKMGNVEPVLMIYRKLPNGNTEVQVRMYYSYKDMTRQARDVIRQELLKESKELGDKIECIINGFCPVDNTK